ncbi:invasion associated locus B family protein [Hoeflea prorocentri]|uniref:Invasion associated locus B family protein n=1 Tax=Hoeflea prorocentri TaxID=1922333 RepID=A0A9X3ZGP1_9HYPH|nr:invasion associated locus B family protein [Hoeflea prorocentri]MCY6380011.1 invasion associated locus B family protein [Hoeflea prorocentri]MDA5397811.1 invasion associated locus B family protein [Hoeflea prorocentri]
MYIPFLVFLVAVSLGAVLGPMIVPQDKFDRIIDELPDTLRAAWAKTEIIEDLLTYRPDRLTTASTKRIKPRQPSPVPLAVGIPVGTWLYKCNVEEASETSCSVTHQVSDQGKVNFSWRIEMDPQGGYSAIWRAATGIRIDQGLVLEAGSDDTLSLDFRSCVDRYCETTASLDPKLVGTLLTTDRITATVHDTQDRPVTYSIDVNGLATGLRMLDDERNSI